MNRSLIALSSLALAVPVFAQTVHVTPKVMASGTTRPTSAYWNRTMFYGTSSGTTKADGHTQFFYDKSEMPAKNSIFKSVSFRRPQGLGNINKAGKTTFSMNLLGSKTQWDKFSTTFATNTVGATNVFSGSLTLQARTNPATWPSVWEAKIPFSKVFVWNTASSTLVVDTTSTGQTTGSTWYVESGRTLLGTRKTVKSACAKDSGGCRNSSLSHSTPSIGRAFSVTHSNFSKYNNPNAFLVGGLRKDKWLSFTLPVSMTSLGLPNANNCNLDVAADFLFQVKQQTRTTGTCPGYFSSPSFNIPNRKFFAGLRFFTQIVAEDNSRSIYSSWSNEWLVGPVPGTEVAGANLYGIGSGAGAATGRMLMQDVATLRFASN